MRQKITNICIEIIRWMTIVIVGYLLFVSLFNTCVMVYTDEHVFYLKNPGILMFAGLMILAILGRKISQRVRARNTQEVMSWQEATDQGLTGKLSLNRFQRIILLVITVLYLVCVAGMILSTQLYPQHDPRSVYEAAVQFYHGDYSAWQVDGYMYMFPYQNGLMLLELPWITVFGEQAYLAMQLYYMLLWLWMSAGAALIATSLWDVQIGRWTYAGFLLFLPMWGYTTYLYGNLPGLAFALWSYVCILYYLKKKHVWLLIGGGLCMLIAVMYKPHFEIFAIAMIIVLLLKLIGTKQVRICMVMLVIILAVLGGTKGVSGVMHLWIGADTTHGAPLLANVAMGVRESNIAPGWYNKLVILAYEAGEGTDVAAMKAYASEQLREGLQLFREVPSYAVAFFGRKIASLWSQPAFECFTALTKRNMEGTLSYFWKDLLYNGGIGNTILILLMDVMQSATYLGVFIYLIGKRRRDASEILLLLTFLGGFLFHIAWEGKTQYTIIFYVVLIPYAVYGWKILMEAESDWVKKRVISLAVATCILTAIPTSFLQTTLKASGEEADYRYFLAEGLTWKDGDYHY